MLLIQLTGLSGSGKSTLAYAVQQRLLTLGYKVEVIDGDVYRSHICSDLGFSKSDRIENIRRLGFIGLILARQGVIAILAAINPYEAARTALQNESPLVRTVFLSCALEALMKNDTKGLYKRALLPKDHPDFLDNFTGISAPYEPPSAPDLVLHTHEETEESSIQKLLAFVLEQTNSHPNDRDDRCVYAGHPVDI
ncbi:MAG: adenylyl-sulfate kinase [Phycisphaerae bacterium]|nr:adenylyl-sulfate kinase [Saprospiraceae bacterium]